MIAGIDYLRELNLLSILVRIMLALLVGGALGLERSRKNRAAGFRTYMLVCLGSALVMMTNQYVTKYYPGADPVRMGAQVISGIGFLGAGTILLTGRSQVRGITTAAGLWAAACCGLAIGIGFYEGALLGGFAVLIVMALLRGVDHRLHQNDKQIDLYLEFDNGHALKEFIVFARQGGYDIVDLHLSSNKLSKDLPLSVTLSVISPVRVSHTAVISLLNEAKGVSFIEEI